MNTTPRRLSLRCDHPDCHYRAASVVMHEGHLVLEIKSRHGGEWHTTRIRIDEIEMQASEEAAEIAT